MIPAAVRRTLLTGAAAGLCAVGVVVAVPGGHELDNVLVFLAYLVPFFLAVETVASIQPTWFARGRLTELVGVGGFVLVFLVFVPKMFDRVLADDYDGFYAQMRILTPLLILLFALQYRLGGGAAGSVRRMAYASLLVMLSGIEDLLFHVWRGGPIPARWDWADHMTVRLGHVASRTEAYVFIAVHLLAAAAVLLWPTSRTRRGRAPVNANTPVTARHDPG